MTTSTLPTESGSANAAPSEAVAKRGFKFDPMWFFTSIKVTVAMLALVAATILVGAWCPQESQVGQEKVIEQFGPNLALTLTQWGITDIYHSTFFLVLIGLVSINLIVASFSKVFPRLKLLKVPLPWLNSAQIGKLPFNLSVTASPERAAAATLDEVAQRLKRLGYKVNIDSAAGRLQAEFGKFGRLAPTTTHIGLLALLLGVTITSWTGFTGFKPVELGSQLSFGDSQHAKWWVGKLPDWTVRVKSTRRENYQSGEAKQWFSDLEVLDKNGKVVKSQEISVNNPLSYDGVDIYQSSWGMDHIDLSFNEHVRPLDLRPMGKLFAAFLPLDQDTILIFSVKDQDSKLRVFAKRKEWQEGPKLLTEIDRGGSVTLGGVVLTYKGAVPVTGLQYKSDPGLWITYIAFGFIMVGVSLAAVPHRQVWAAVVDARGESDGGGRADERSPQPQVVLGGKSVKARVGFERQLKSLAQKIERSKNSESGINAEVMETSNV